VKVVTTEVGDRAVLAAMEDGGYVLGGEQSGHIINLHHATTGDGVLAAVTLLQMVRRAGGSLAEMAGSVMQRIPQLLRNVRVTNKPADVEALLGAELVHERAALGNDGRIVVRTSGTEPVIRIMVEAASSEIAEATADRLERLIVARV
jgi:phosphoglucosamine mutase